MYAITTAVVEILEVVPEILVAPLDRAIFPELLNV